MALSDYFPTKVAGMRAWAGTYKANIANQGTALEMTSADILKEQEACDGIIDSIQEYEDVKALLKKKKKDKDAAIKASMNFLRPKIRGHKSKNGYNKGIGELLGVIGTDKTVDPLTVKTIVKVKKVPQGIDIKFGLEGCEGGNVYSKRGTENMFTRLKYIIHPHTIDTRHNEEGATVEQRQYYVILNINDEEVGVPSDIVTINN